MAETIFHITWLVEAELHQLSDSCLSGGRLQGRNECPPLWRDFRVGRQTGNVDELFRIGDCLFVERRDPHRKFHRRIRQARNRAANGSRSRRSAQDRRRYRRRPTKLPEHGRGPPSVEVSPSDRHPAPIQRPLPIATETYFRGSQTAFMRSAPSTLVPLAGWSILRSTAAAGEPAGSRAAFVRHR